MEKQIRKTVEERMNIICEKNDYKVKEQLTMASVDSKFLVEHDGETFITSLYQMEAKGIIPHIVQKEKIKKIEEKRLAKVQETEERKAKIMEVQKEFSAQFEAEINDLKNIFKQDLAELKLKHKEIIRNRIQEIE